MNKPTYNFGDIVKVAGYWPRIFEVDGRRIENWQYPDEEWTDIVYEVFDVLTADYIECCEDDITLVCEADKAEEYLEANPPHYEAPAPIRPDWMTIMFGGEETMSKSKEPLKPTARELSAKEAEERKRARKEKSAKIDRMLDELNDYKRLVAQFGDEEYKAMVEFITRKLEKLTE